MTSPAVASMSQPRTPHHATPVALGIVPDAVSRCLDAQREAVKVTGWRRVFGQCPLADGARIPFAEHEAELAMAARLRELPTGWATLDPFALGSPSLTPDQVLVGPAGVFVLDAVPSDAPQRPSHSSATIVSANTRDAHMRSEWSRALEQDVPVQSVLVVEGGRAASHERIDPNVVVVPAAGLRDFLSVQPIVLSEEHAAQLEEMARAKVPARADTREVEHEFSALRRAVYAARATRQRWLIGLGSTAIVVAVSAIVSGLISS